MNMEPYHDHRDDQLSISDHSRAFCRDLPLGGLRELGQCNEKYDHRAVHLRDAASGRILYDHDNDAAKPTLMRHNELSASSDRK
jgi:hypothetical protein